jgi:hypothetical protein
MTFILKEPSQIKMISMVPANKDSHKIYPTMMREIDAFLNKRDLSRDQNRLANQMKKYFEALGPVGARKMPAPNPPFILLTGNPGSGKSYATDSVIALADLMRVGTTPACSHNVIAAFYIDGVTLCKLLGISSHVGNNSKTSIGDDAL